MAPYVGDVADVDVNELEFFKFAEDTTDGDGVWGTDRLIDNTNGTWTATIPADIKPGNYIIRQEVCKKTWPWIILCILSLILYLTLYFPDHRPSLCHW